MCVCERVTMLPTPYCCVSVRGGKWFIDAALGVLVAGVRRDEGGRKWGGARWSREKCPGCVT